MPSRPETVEILDPRTVRVLDGETKTYGVDGPIRGKVVGLRLDDLWRSYETVVDEWSQLLAADGAVPRVLQVGDREGEEGARTRADLDEWSRLVEIGVIGLGN